MSLANRIFAPINIRNAHTTRRLQKRSRCREERGQPCFLRIIQATATPLGSIPHVMSLPLTPRVGTQVPDARAPRICSPPCLAVRLDQDNEFAHSKQERARAPTSSFVINPLAVWLQNALLLLGQPPKTRLLLQLPERPNQSFEALRAHIRKCVHGPRLTEHPWANTGSPTARRYGDINTRSRR
jgi:hypothetical protein